MNMHSQKDASSYFCCCLCCCCYSSVCVWEILYQELCNYIFWVLCFTFAKSFSIHLKLTLFLNYNTIYMRCTWAVECQWYFLGDQCSLSFYFKLLTPRSADPLTLSVCCLQRSGRLKERCSEQQRTKQDVLGHRCRHHGSIRLDCWNEQAWWLKLAVGCCRAALNDEISCSEERSVPPFVKNMF